MINQNRIKVLIAVLGLALIVGIEVFIAVRCSKHDNGETENLKESILGEALSEEVILNPEDYVLLEQEDTNEFSEYDSGLKQEQPFVLSKLKKDVDIKVLICNQDFKSKYHDKFSLKSKDGFRVLDTQGEEVFSFGKGQNIASSKLKIQVGDTIWVEGNQAEIMITSLNRAQGIPTYKGRLIITRTEQGYILINEVNMEDYLCSVVPSEMPSTFPLEALKCQAVSARTYAYYYYCYPGLAQYGANMDDSTNYQVYNNIALTESTTLAVEETRGEILLKAGAVHPTFFFSTSCGNTTVENVFRTFDNKQKSSLYHSVHVMKNKEDSYACFAEINDTNDLMKEENFRKFISTKEEDAVESEAAYYRWNVTLPINAKEIYGRIKNCYEQDPESVLLKGPGENEFYSGYPKQPQKIKNISVESRLDGGVADILCIEMENDTVKICKEYFIRQVLSDEKTEVLRQDGQKVVLGKLLPSGFIVVDQKKTKEGNVTSLNIQGGGLGHGVGMSQVGAKYLAEEGMDYQNILDIFY